MTRLVRWLYLRLGAWLERRNAMPGQAWLPAPGDDEADAAEADAPLPPAILDALREMRRMETPISAREIAAAPTAMPVADVRFVVWSRGFVDTTTDDPGEAKTAWARVTQRAGIHQFWDRTHQPPLRAERIVPALAPPP